MTEKHCYVGRNPDDMSPWGLFFAYRICAYQIANNSQGTCSPDSDKVAKSMRETFSTIDKRWNLAGSHPSLHLIRRLQAVTDSPSGVYLQLLEAQETMRFS